MPPLLGPPLLLPRIVLAAQGLPLLLARLMAAVSNWIVRLFLLLGYAVVADDGLWIDREMVKGADNPGTGSRGRRRCWCPLLPWQPRWPAAGPGPLCSVLAGTTFSGDLGYLTTFPYFFELLSVFTFPCPFEYLPAVVAPLFLGNPPPWQPHSLAHQGRLPVFGFTVPSYPQVGNNAVPAQLVAD